MTEVPEPVAVPAAATAERRDVPWRFAILVLSAYVLVAALSGVVWEWLWTPPAQFVQQHQLYYVDYAALRRVFDGAGLYVLVAALASALVALVVCVATRRHELVTLGLVIVGSVLAAFVMREVGYALGPPDPAIAAKTAADGTRLDDQLRVAGLTPLLVWPMTSLFILALTFFAWPGRPHGPGWGEEEDTAHEAESGNDLTSPASVSGLVARRIRESLFTPISLRSGYVMGDVDTMLDDAERAALAGDALAPVLRRELPQASARETYATTEVDALVDRLLTGPLGLAYESARLGDSGADSLSEPERRMLTLIGDAELRVRKRGGGYAIADVDSMLDEAFVAVLRRQSPEPALQKPLARVENGRAYDAAAVDAFLTRLRTGS